MGRKRRTTSYAGGFLLVNSSPNRNGNTAALAEKLLSGHDYETVMLTDYRINFLGQDLPGDEFDKILEKIQKSDVVVFGSPVYWHNISGALRTLIERFYGPADDGSLHGKFFFLFQGAAPEKWMLDNGEYTMKRFAAMYGLTYEGMASTVKEAEKLASKI